MYRLRVIAAPANEATPGSPVRGASYELAAGETSLGRSGDNGVVLPSGKVSKRHCVLVVDNTSVTLKDTGSSNGTFVNGSLAKQKKLRAGDRIGVGEYMLEIVETAPPRSLQLATSSRLSLSPRLPGARPASATGISSGKALAAASKAPTDLKGKVFHAFESKAMPVFYEMSQKSEWKIVCAGVIGIYALISVFLTLSPLMGSTRSMIIRETTKRAQFMARQLSDSNTPAMAARSESKVEVPESMQNGSGVRLAIVTDMDSRIIAPATQLNQYLVKGSEAKFAVKMRDEFAKGTEKGRAEVTDSGLVVAIEPVRVLNPTMGKNVTVAMAIVSIDVTVSTPGLSELGVIYSDAFIMVALLGALVCLVLYRLTMKPLENLNDDMDKVLQGDLQAVTREYRWEELNSLFELVNSTLQRAVRSAGGGGLDPSAREITSDEYLASIQGMADVLKSGMVVCGPDQRVIYLNNEFETVSGIRGDRAMGQTLSDAAVDQGFSQLMADMLSRCETGGQAVVETCEFGGIPYQVFASAFGPVGSTPRCYLLSFVKSEY